jgi:hypothetical protein
MNKEKENAFSRFTSTTINRPQYINNHPNQSITSNYKSASNASLPPLKEANKFSSWADKSLFE